MINQNNNQEEIENGIHTCCIVVKQAWQRC